MTIKGRVIKLERKHGGMPSEVSLYTDAELTRETARISAVLKRHYRQVLQEQYELTGKPEFLPREPLIRPTAKAMVYAQQHNGIFPDGWMGLPMPKVDQTIQELAQEVAYLDQEIEFMEGSNYAVG
jgi:hypothetical protein